MPLDIQGETVVVRGNSPHTDPNCPNKDAYRESDDPTYDLVHPFGARDLWNTIHARADYVEATTAPGLDRTDRDERILDAISALVYPMCSACKQRVITDVFFTMLKQGQLVAY